MPENNQPPIICPFCQSPVREIPAGVSKRTGKPYNRFWACSNRDCSFTWRPEQKTTKPVEGNVMEEIVGKVIDNKLAGVKESLKIINENLIAISEGLTKLLKK